MDAEKGAEEDALEQVRALPYDAFLHGPPVTPCDEHRLAYLVSTGALDKPSDPQVEHILRLVAQIFQVEIVVVSLCARQRVYVSNAHGFHAGEFGWRWAFCAWNISSRNPEVLVIENAQQDARMRQSDKAVEGGLRFFAGAPLVGSNGHRLGSLMMMDSRPHSPSAEQCGVLTNMAELVVRELEKEAAQAAQAAALAVAGQQVNRYMRRALACFDTRAVLFVEVLKNQPWRALHANDAFSQVTGISYEETTSHSLFALFQLPFEAGSDPWTALMDIAARGDEFVIRRLSLQQQRGGAGAYTLTFRPARLGAFDEDTQLVGVPANIPSAPAGMQADHYFVIVSPEEATDAAHILTQSAQEMSLRRNVPPTNVPIDDLVLGPLLGKGSFGRVYRGRLHGKSVAVKICTQTLSGGKQSRCKPWRSVEAVQSRGLDHPGIMRTIKFMTVLVQDGNITSCSFSDGDSSGGTPDPDLWGDECGWPTEDGDTTPPAITTQLEMWLILEYCNRGSLESGVERGWFQEKPGNLGGSAPKLSVVLQTAAQLASAMAYLHERDIIHGDLCGGNVLLTSDAVQQHGFSCKVADFGLARDMELNSRMHTASYGTVTHMPPELLSEGKLSKAADVYAFGILLWEMCTASRAWAGMSHTQVLTSVVYKKQRLQFPPYIDRDVVELATACMHHDAEQRPTFQQIMVALEAMQKQSI